MVGAIHTGGVQVLPRVGGAGASAREPNSSENEGAKRPPSETSGNAAVRVPPSGPGGASAFNAQVAAQDQEKKDQGRNEGDETGASKPKATTPGELSEDERRVVRKLQARDREVRAHEAAHQAAGGGLAGAASFTLQKGPDGRRYAVGGEVPIDASPVAGDPDATITKLRTVKRAALAPAEPSSTDRRIASSADSGIRQAQVAKQKQSTEERSEGAAKIAPQEDGGGKSAAPAIGAAVGENSTGPEPGDVPGTAAPQPAGASTKIRPPGSTLSLLA